MSSVFPSRSQDFLAVWSIFCIYTLNPGDEMCWCSRQYILPLKKVLCYPQKGLCRRTQNHGMGWVRSNFKDHLVPAPCHEQGHPAHSEFRFLKAIPCSVTPSPCPKSLSSSHQREKAEKRNVAGQWYQNGFVLMQVMQSQHLTVV